MRDLTEVLEYRDGKLFWKETVNYVTAQRGWRAGRNRPDGYRSVTFKGKKYLEHRLIFFLHHGYWPEYVDHIDRDKNNNRIENLREVSAYESACNRGGYKEDDEGISLHHGKYQLVYRGKYMGRFGTKEEARLVRDEGGVCGI